jgi:predicted flavoprotein YhiN
MVNIMTDFGIEGSFAIRVSRRALTLADYERAARVVLRDAENITHSRWRSSCGAERSRSAFSELLMSINGALQLEQD